MCSAAYNLASDGPIKAILRRFDYAAIFFKIASTYTPFAAIKVGGWAGGGLLTVVWTIALFGLTLKLLFPERLIKTSYFLYLAQGWAGVIFFVPLVNSLSNLTLILLGLGGILYTVGVAFHLWQTLRYHNAIWHGFVLCASCFHFVAVLDAFVLA
jgi:hemolysin III